MNRFSVVLTVLFLLTGCGSQGSASGAPDQAAPEASVRVNEAPGLPGPKGDPGPAGPVGPAGAQGPTGPQGSKGDTGAAGPQGPQGVQGAQGHAGTDGAQGFQGPAGPMGPQGLRGLTGAQGIQGPKGDAGGGITKAGLYTVTKQITIGANSGGEALAVCTNVKDVVLNGGCSNSTSNLGMYLSVQHAINASDATEKAAWSCQGTNYNSTQMIVVAYATCLIIP